MVQKAFLTTNFVICLLLNVVNLFLCIKYVTFALLACL